LESRDIVVLLIVWWFAVWLFHNNMSPGIKAVVWRHSISMHIMCSSANLQGICVNYSEAVLFKGIVPLLFLLLFPGVDLQEHSVMNVVWLSVVTIKLLKFHIFIVMM